MTELITRPGAWLLEQAVTFPDTVVMKAVAAPRDWFEIVTGVANVVLTLTVLGIVIVLAPVAWAFWRDFQRLRALLDRVSADITPLTRHASNVADNLDYITTSIRNDVQQVNATIATANRRLRRAVEVTEARLNDFNALLGVVQEEAEHAFVSTAAAVHGVRTGAAALGALNDDDRPGEGDDENGNDHGSDEDASDEGRASQRFGATAGDRAARPARPRLRPRRGRRGRRD